LTPLKQTIASVWIKWCQSVRSCPKPPCCMARCSIYLQWHWHDSHVSMCGSAYQPSEALQFCSVQVFSVYQHALFGLFGSYSCSESYILGLFRLCYFQFGSSLFYFHGISYFNFNIT
jgi:hypothetical protein